MKSPVLNYPSLTTVTRGRLGFQPRAMRNALNRILRWGDRRRQRIALSDLDDRLLADVGISRTEAEAEIAKPFWR